MSQFILKVLVFLKDIRKLFCVILCEPIQKIECTNNIIYNQTRYCVTEGVMKILEKIVVVTGLLVLVMEDGFAMNSLYIAANVLKTIRQTEQSKETKKWRLENDLTGNNEKILKCQYEIDTVRQLRKELVPQLYKAIQHPKLAELLPPKADLSTLQQESLIMFVSQMDSGGNVKIVDPYLVVAPINILSIEPDTTSSYILGKMIEKIPAEFLEGSDFQP